MPGRVVGPLKNGAYILRGIGQEGSVLLIMESSYTIPKLKNTKKGKH